MSCSCHKRLTVTPAVPGRFFLFAGFLGAETLRNETTGPDGQKQASETAKLFR